MFRSPTRVGRRDLRLLADEDLIVHVRDGDAFAFEVIFDRHSGAAFWLAYRMCGRRAPAEDVVQDAFMSLWRGGMRYERSRGSVRTWVLAVVRNKAVTRFATRQRRPAGTSTTRPRPSECPHASGPMAKPSAALTPDRFAARWQRFLQTSEMWLSSPTSVGSRTAR